MPPPPQHNHARRSYSVEFSAGQLRYGHKPEIADDPEQAAMIRMALAWLPFGGTSAADILVTFGISEAEFYTRILAVSDDPETAKGVPPELDQFARDRMQDMASELA